MKVRHRSILMLASYLLAMVLGVFTPLLSSPAYAENSLPNGSKLDDRFIYYYNTSDKEELQKAFKNHEPSSPVISNTFVYVRDGIFGNKPFQMTYDPGQTQGVGAVIKSTYWFNGNYKCYVDSSGAHRGKPNDANAEYYDIDLTAILKLDDNYATNKETFKIGAGGTKYDKTTSAVPAKTHEINSFSDIPAGCQPPTFSEETRIMNTYYNANKNDWPGVEEASAAGASGGTGEAGGGDCGGVDFAWIFCKLIHGAENSVGWVEKNFIEPFLDVKPLSFNADCKNSPGDNPTYCVWNSIRNIANGIFVLIFLVFIFATTLRINVNAYTIKKMLPKLIAAAILVQFSFLLMSLAIDITNILGRGMFDLATAIIPKFNGEAGNFGTGAINIGLTAAVGAAAVLATGGIVATIFVLISAAFFGAMAVFLTLVFRQILIIMLIITAPLAFAAWVLPNTEKFFKTWANLFIKALLMYPIIALLFAAGRLFTASAGAADLNGFTLAPIFALVGATAPLFVIPFAFKFAGGAMAAGAAVIQGRAGGFGKGLTKEPLEDIRQQRKEKGLEQYATSDKRLGKYMGAVRAGTMLPASAAAKRRLAGGYNKMLKDREDAISQQFDNAQVSLNLEGDKIGADGKSLKPGDRFKSGLVQLARGESALGVEANAASQTMALKRLTAMRAYKELSDLREMPLATNPSVQVGNTSAWQTNMQDNIGQFIEAAPDIAFGGKFDHFKTLTPSQLADMHDSTIERAMNNVATLKASTDENERAEGEAIETGLMAAFKEAQKSTVIRNKINRKAVGQLIKAADAGALAPENASFIRDHTSIVSRKDDGSPESATILEEPSEQPRIILPDEDR